MTTNSNTTQPETKQTTQEPHTDRRAAFIRQASLPLPDDDDDDQIESKSHHGPRLHVRWLHAQESGKGWTSFSVKDSRALEDAWIKFQKDSSQDEQGTAQLGKQRAQPHGLDTAASEAQVGKDDERKPIDPDQEPAKHKVGVLLDKLYDAALRDMKMSPVFWKGPDLDITRACWFYESNKLTPCPMELADELEHHFHMIKPWLSSYTDELKSSVSLGSDAEDKLKCPLTSAKQSYVIFQGPRLARLYTQDFSTRLSKHFFTAWNGEHGGGQLLVRGYQTAQQLIETRKGAGAFSSSPRIKKDYKKTNLSNKSSVASELSHDSIAPCQTFTTRPDKPEEKEAVCSKIMAVTQMADQHANQMESSVVEMKRSQPSIDVDTTNVRVTPGAIQGGAGAQLRDLITAAKSRAASQSGNELLKSVATKFGTWTGSSQVEANSSSKETEETRNEPAGEYQETGERDQVGSCEQASLVEGGSLDNPEEFDDFQEKQESESQSTEPPELILAIHGIGQRLAGEWKSFDFTSAINNFRGLIQTRIDSAKPPSDIDGGGLKSIAGNRRIQIIPVLWESGFHHESDLEGVPRNKVPEDDNDYDNGLELEMDHVLSDEGIPILKTLTRDVLMDIPMYLSKHRQHIITCVIQEANRQYRVFTKRNPAFEERGGRVHIIAHSLGSVIATDILSNQPTRVPLLTEMEPDEIRMQISHHFLFNVEKYFAVGSPAGLFFVINRAQLIARHGRQASEEVLDSAGNKPVKATLDEQGKYGCLAVSGFYNVWNQYDPVAARCTPCVDAQLAKLLKPLPLSKAIRSVLLSFNRSRSEENKGSGLIQEKNPKDMANDSSSHRSQGLLSSWGKKAGEAAALLTLASASTKVTNKQEDKEEIAGENQEKSTKNKLDDICQRLDEEEHRDRSEKQEKENERHGLEMNAKRKQRAEARLGALNPMQRVDFIMPLESSSLLSTINQYAELMTAHVSYWSRNDFADFMITQLLTDQDTLKKSAEFQEMEKWD